jgi:hypothetical protein
MSLTPKEWKSFQHYKERRPPWIKLHRTLLDNADFQRLPVASRALAPMLWLIAAEYENGAITATAEDIAWRLRMTVDELRAALGPLIEKGFFVSDEGDSEALADRKQDLLPEIETQVEKEEEIESRSVAEATQPSAGDKFEEFWKAYPRRDGPNPRKPAEQKFNALVKTGLDPEMLIAEAHKLSNAEAKRGNIGTRFIPQAGTWLNQQRWTDHAAVAFSASSIPDRLPIEEAIQVFKRTGQWSRHAPVADISQAPPELLAKHGLMPDGRRMQ